MRHPVSCLLLLACASCGSPDVEPAVVSYAALDLARHGHRIERLGDTLHAFGGFDRSAGAPERGQRQAFAFQLPRGPWVSKADMSRPHAFFGSGVLSDTIYAVGPNVERYDAANDRWIDTSVATPLPRSHFASAAWQGRLHVLGGYPAEAAGHRAFDPGTGLVKNHEAPPGFTPGDHFHILVPLHRRLHAVGGLRAGGSELSKAHHAWDGRAWIQRAPPPVALWAKFAAVAVLGDTLYVFARRGGFAYDARSDRWRNLSPMPVPVAMPATVVLAGRIVVIGGAPLEDGPRAVQVYEPDSDTWSRH